MHRSFVRVAAAVCAVGLVSSGTRIIAEERGADFGAFIASQTCSTAASTTPTTAAR